MSVKHFVLMPSIVTGETKLYAVTDPVISSNGKYTVKTTSIPLMDKKDATKITNFTYIDSVFNVKYDDVPSVTSIAELNKVMTNTRFCTKIKVTKSDLDSMISSGSEFEKLKEFMDIYYDKYKVIRWLDDVGKNWFEYKLFYAEHKRGSWSITRTDYYSMESFRPSMDGNDSNVYTKTTTINQSSKSIRDILQTLSPQQTYDLGYDYRLATPGTVTVFRLVNTIYTMELTKTNTVQLAGSNEWELGALCTKSKIDDTYCFRCNDTSQMAYINAFTTTIPLTLDRKSHSCKIHNEEPPAGSKATSGGSSKSNSNLTYDPYSVTFSGTGVSSAKTVKHLDYGTKGNYVDGVATVPFVFIELSADGSDKTFNLSFPADSFVSLTHERNLSDGYNTFQLQVFDENALKVESKLLLGFRKILFYYTDFVSTSKRFQGEVMDYKSVISGKGLLLTLSGYTSNTDIYTGKDSIPWSYLVEARSLSFYYWLNNAGEYHGTVRMTPGKVMNSDGTVVDESTVYNSEEGTVVAPEYLDKIATDPDNLTYCLKATNSENETYFVTFDRYYKDASPEDIEMYRPRARKWSLLSYNEDLPNELTVPGLNIGSLGEITEPRPSNIVLLICIINGWKWKPEYIAKTKKVTEIPDMISMSFTEYIKKQLIPLSVADTDDGSSQFNFWFDDEGYVHFMPGSSQTVVKSLYFNSREIPNSYPLIAFTASTNGNVLMQTDARQSMEAINVFTGDTIEAEKVEGTENDPKYASLYNTVAEWYATNQFTKKDASKFVSYSNVSSAHSADDLDKQLKYRYGLVSKFTYRANLDVYGCSDITPGDQIDVYIYLGDGVRSTASPSKEDKDSPTGYIGNTTMHHSSGRYFVNKITDTISAGKYVSSLDVLKIDATNSTISLDGNYPTYKDNTPVENKAGTDEAESISFNSYTYYKNLIGKGS